MPDSADMPAPVNTTILSADLYKKSLAQKFKIISNILIYKVLYFLTGRPFATIFRSDDRRAVARFLNFLSFIMADDLSDIDDDLEQDDNSENEISEKDRAQANLEARRRLELKLEEARLRKQISDYDFDID